MRHRIGILATAAATGAIAFSLVSTGALAPASAAPAADEQSLAVAGLQDASAIQQLNDPGSEDAAATSAQAASAVAQSQARVQALMADAQREAQAAAAAQAVAQSAAAPAAAAPVAATPAADDGTAGPDAYRAYARGKVGGGQFSCLDALWKKESGWRPGAKNPNSSAYGIPQLLTATWSATGIGRTSNGFRQIDAGLVYIEAAYGDPCGAWSHSRQTGWY